MNHPICWRDIYTAISIYESCGFKYIEAPWVVSDTAVLLTIPPGVQTLRCQDGALVGSAEQGFIQMMLDGKLPPGKYVAAGPCFRTEKVDRLHQRTFFKVELIEVRPVRRHPIFEMERLTREMAEMALSVFHMLEGGQNAEIVETRYGMDIELNGIEVGSYGFRGVDELAAEFVNLKKPYPQWVYGTGLAEPRFSLATGR